MRKRLKKLAATKKRDNSHLAHKVALREFALAALGKETCRVLDLCAGDGVIASHVYERHDYYGCDRKVNLAARGPRWVCDNKVLLRTVDVVEGFDLIDIDAYGSPWACVYILAKRSRLVRGQKIAIVLTDGASLRANLGRVERHLAALAGVAQDTRGAQWRWPELTAAAYRAAAAMMGGSVEAIRMAPHTTGKMLYSAAIVCGGKAL